MTIVPVENEIRIREDLPFLWNKMNLKGRGAEIGVQQGLFSKHILDYWQGEKLYLIDAWRHFDSGYIDIANGEHNIQLNNMAKTFMEVYAHQSRVVIIRELSVEAAKIFADGFFDWIFLDANHSYDAVKEDLVAWHPKIKKGGIFSGHDYLDSPKAENGHTDFGVKQAVDEWAALHKYKIHTTDKEMFPFWWCKI